MIRFGKLIVIALSGLLALGCQATQSVRNAPLPPPSADAPLTVLTYNIRVGYGLSNPGASPYGLVWGRNLGAVDGRFTDATRSALIAFQSGLDFETTGFPDQTTLWRLLRN